MALHIGNKIKRKIGDGIAWDLPWDRSLTARGTCPVIFI